MMSHTTRDPPLILEKVGEEVGPRT